MAVAVTVGMPVPAVPLPLPLPLLLAGVVVVVAAGLVSRTLPAPASVTRTAAVSTRTAAVSVTRTAAVSLTQPVLVCLIVAAPVTVPALMKAVAAPMAAIPVRVAVSDPLAGARTRSGIRVRPDAGPGDRSLTAGRPTAACQAAQPSRVPRLPSRAWALGTPGSVRTPWSATADAEIPRVSLTAPGGAAGAVGRAVSATGPTRRLGREWGMGCRGHRPIIARTTGAPCSPRPS